MAWLNEATHEPKWPSTEADSHITRNKAPEFGLLTGSGASATAAMNYSTRTLNTGRGHRDSIDQYRLVYVSATMIWKEPT